MKSSVQNVDTENFRRILRENEGKILAKFWASWCAPCRDYAPEYEKASSQNSHVLFLNINGEIEPALNQEFNIRGIPCTILFKEGREVKRHTGYMSAEQIKKILKD